ERHDRHRPHHPPGLPPPRRPRGLAGLLPRHPRLRGAQRRRVHGHALAHGRAARAARDVDRPAPAGRRPGHHRRGAPDGLGDDGQGHVREHQPGDHGPRQHLRATPGRQRRRRRGRPGADGPAVGHPRLRPARPRRQHDPHLRGAL
ncbi:MAG: putative lyase, partial [uncultured Actinomycetospora sp.]